MYTLAVGAMALGEESLLANHLQSATASEQARVAYVAIAGVTIGSAVANHIRLRRERELRQARTVADVTQRVLLRPVPHEAGSVRLITRYLSASSHARIGGDLYAAVPTAHGLRLIVGDAVGKGLPAVQQAAAAMGAFRVTAYEERTLSALPDRIESILQREFGDEQFITAVLAEVSTDGDQMAVINCGHPRPMRFGPGGPDLLGPPDGGLPLGLGPLAAGSRIPFTIPLTAGRPVLFYTDGLTDARNRAGAFFPLTGFASVLANADPHTLVDRLSAQVRRHVAGHLHDDVALLLVYRLDSNPPMVTRDSTGAE